MNPEMSKLLMDTMAEALAELFSAKEAHEAVEGFIDGLRFKFSLLDADSIDKEEFGYTALLMAANQAYTDGVAAKMAERVSNVIKDMYYAGELPPESMERIRENMEKQK